MRINIGNQYYEAILQLRPENKEIISFVKKRLKESNVNITKEVNYKYGVDYYLTSRKVAIAIGRKLKKSFKGEVKLSRSLYGVNRVTSKKLYRVTVLFRLKEEQ